MANIIYDVCSGVQTNWNESVINRPTILEGTEKFSQVIYQNMPMNEIDNLYVSNPKSEAIFVNPERTLKDVIYHVNIHIKSNTGSNRDDMFDEAYRIVEATGITDYDNRYIESYTVKNEFSYFTADINFNIIKYNESVTR